MDNPLPLNHLQNMTRRHFLSSCQLGIGGMALSSLLGDSASGHEEAATHVARPHFPAKAKSILYLHMTGSPPNLDMYDPKPELVRRTAEDCPAEFFDGKEFAFTKGTPTLLGSPHKFRKCGQSGAWLSDVLTDMEQVVDDICFVKSTTTDQFNHAPAELLLFTGSPRIGRPAFGSWVTWLRVREPQPAGLRRVDLQWLKPQQRQKRLG